MPPPLTTPLQLEPTPAPAPPLPPHPTPATPPLPPHPTPATPTATPPPSPPPPPPLAATPKPTETEDNITLLLHAAHLQRLAVTTPTMKASDNTIVISDIPACLQHEIAARVKRTILRAIPKKAPRPKLSQADPRYTDLRRRMIKKAKTHALSLLDGSMLTEEQERLIDNVRLDATFRTHENPENPTHYDITLYYGELAPVEDTRYKVHSSHALGRGALSYPTPLSKPSPKRKRFSPPADALSA